MVFKLKMVLVFFILLNLNLVVFTRNDLEAQIKDYGDALSEILKVHPPIDDIEEAKEKYLEPEKSDVEFSKDMKFLNMTLMDSIILAIHNNYEIKIAKIEPMINEKNITVEKSKFDPILKLTGERKDMEEPTANRLVTGIAPVTEITPFNQVKNTIKAEIEKTIITGGKFTASLYSDTRDKIDPAPFRPLNPQSKSYIEAKYTQPILRGAGIFYNRSEIYIARNNKEKSILELKETAIKVINDVQKAYWDLVMEIENLRVRKKSLESAEDLLKKNKIQVEVGTLAPIELLVAEDGVAKRINEIIETENDIKNKEDALKLIMNLSNHSILSDVAIIPLDKASFKIKNVAFDESIKLALANRPELFKQGLDITNARITVKEKRNELLPRLDAEVGIRYSGLDSNFEDSLDSIFSERYQSEFFSLILEVPIGNREARSNYTQAKLEARREILKRSKQEQEIVVEVRTAVREIKKNAESIKATEKARELARERLVAEEKKFKVGRSTSLEVLRAQSNLTLQEGQAVQALINYQKSLGNLDAKMGTILKNNNIVLEGTDLVTKESASLGRSKNNKQFK